REDGELLESLLERLDVGFVEVFCQLTGNHDGEVDKHVKVVNGLGQVVQVRFEAGLDRRIVLVQVGKEGSEILVGLEQRANGTIGFDAPPPPAVTDRPVHGIQSDMFHGAAPAAGTLEDL